MKFKTFKKPVGTSTVKFSVCPHCGQKRRLKISPDDRQAIKELPVGYVRAAARVYGVDRRTIQRIRNEA